VTAAKRMIERTQDRFGLWPEKLAADAGYGSDGTFERADFTYDIDRDVYTCPGGNELRRYWQESRAAKAKPSADGLDRYRARKTDCDACALKLRCYPNEPQRKVLRSIHEGARNLRAPSQGPMPIHFAARTEEDRDAVCTSQTYPKARSLASQRAKWRKR
jgi:hypothetical protein